MAYRFSRDLGGAAPVGGPNYLPVDLEAVALDGAAQYLTTEPVKAPANYKDEAKIAAYVADATAARLHKLALDPDLCRIVAIGWRNEQGRAVTITAKDAHEERDALDAFWTDLRDTPTVTFNGFGYDLPVIMRRSQYLGVRGRKLNLDRYRSPHVDLMQQLSFNGVLPYHSLRFYCQRFDIPCARPDLSGALVGQLAAAGEYPEIAAHCADDVEMTAQLAMRLGYAVLPLAVERSALPDSIF